MALQQAQHETWPLVFSSNHKHAARSTFAAPSKSNERRSQPDTRQAEIAGPGGG